MLVIIFKLVNHYSKDRHYMHPWCGYRVRSRSQCRCPQRVSPCHWCCYADRCRRLHCRHCHHSMEQVCAHSYQSECTIIYNVQYGASVCTLLPIRVRHNLLCTVWSKCVHTPTNRSFRYYSSTYEWVPATLGPNRSWRHKTTTQSIIRGTGHFC